MTAELLLALTLYFEAGNQSHEGKVAVAQVIMQRVYDTKGTVESVVRKPKQFSCWNDRHGEDVLVKPNKAIYECMKIAEGCLSGKIQPSGWTHYYNPKLARPKWAKKMTNKKKIGDHIFGTIKEKK